MAQGLEKAAERVPNTALPGEAPSGGARPIVSPIVNRQVCRRGGAVGRRLGLLFALVLAVLGLLPAPGPQAAQPARTAVVLDLDAAIGPATGDYLSRGLAHAAARQAGLVVLRMDTPGGLESSMREMIRAILASPVPVATFVHPHGARAASAGTFILYASHIAAMAPGTTLGAATPVPIGGRLPFGRDAEEGGDQAEQRRAPRDAMAAKAVELAVAYIRGLAELRGRNADWAEKAVREAASLSEREAAEQTVIDFVARDVAELLALAHGRTVTVAGAPVTLDTRDLAIEVHPPDWRTRILLIITNPNVALILLMIGIYGLIFEFMNPGALVPGTVGAIALLLGLYAMALLPVNYAGAALMLLGIALMVAEAVTPFFGVLGISGVAAFVLGAMILMDPDVPGFALAWPLVGAIALATLAFSLLVVRMAWSAQRRRMVAGREALIGAAGRVVDWQETAGHVAVQGERWRAVSPTPLRAGQAVRVARVRDLTLEVEPDERPTTTPH